MHSASKFSTRRVVAALSGAALVATFVLSVAAQADAGSGFRPSHLILVNADSFVQATIPLEPGSWCVIQKGKIGLKTATPGGPERQPKDLPGVERKVDTKDIEGKIDLFLKKNLKSLGEVVVEQSEVNRFTLDDAKTFAESNHLSPELAAEVSALRSDLRDLCLAQPAVTEDGK